jgi:uncharacterized surface protein with fasciclin (FAS1) repeats
MLKMSPAFLKPRDIFQVCIAKHYIAMKKFFLSLLVIGSAALFNTQAKAQGKDIVDIAVGSPAHTTLVAAVKAADLVGVLKGSGPFTVFAPTNDAFGKLPAGTVETLLKPENKGKLSAVLTYHVVAGNIGSKDVVEAIKKGNGKAVVNTVQGQPLTLSLDGSKVKVTDANGNSAFVTAVDLAGSNGVIHVIDGVILPKS